VGGKHGLLSILGQELHIINTQCFLIVKLGTAERGTLSVAVQ
jgi:hypothetical protein